MLRAEDGPEGEDGKGCVRESDSWSAGEYRRREADCHEDEVHHEANDATKHPVAHELVLLSVFEALCDAQTDVDGGASHAEPREAQNHREDDLALREGSFVEGGHLR